MEKKVLEGKLSVYHTGISINNTFLKGELDEFHGLKVRITIESISSPQEKEDTLLDKIKLIGAIGIVSALGLFAIAALMR